jgi:carbonic anhydrase
MLNKEISRRDALKGTGIAGIASLFTFGFGATGAFAEGRPDEKVIDGEKALTLLKKGNRRWVRNKPIRKSYAPAGKTLEDGQWPIAAVLGCADSRVQPDELFDIAPANLFVVRNAGNVVDDNVLGSLEYAIEHLGVQLIVAMGHQACGAVKAADAFVLKGARPGGHIDVIAEEIAPAIRALPATHTIDEAVKANSIQSAKQLISRSSILEEAIASGKVKLVSGVYSLHTKAVSFNAASE